MQTAKYVVMLPLCLPVINPHYLLPKWIIKRGNWLTDKVNFMCQRERAIEYPDIWSNIIPCVSVRVLLDEINIWTSNLSKADCLSNVCGPHPINWKPKLNQMTDPWIRGSSSCLADALWHKSFHTFGSSWVLILSALVLKLTT